MAFFYLVGYISGDNISIAEIYNCDDGVSVLLAL
jgi:hypothetical protein